MFNTAVVDTPTMFSHFYESKLFKSKVISRVKFDPTNSEHRKAFAYFIKHGKWTMYFYIELPYLSVPHTIQAKLAEYALQKELKDLE